MEAILVHFVFTLRNCCRYSKKSTFDPHGLMNDLILLFVGQTCGKYLYQNVLQFFSMCTRVGHIKLFEEYQLYQGYSFVLMFSWFQKGIILVPTWISTLVGKILRIRIISLFQCFDIYSPARFKISFKVDPKN